MHSAMTANEKGRALRAPAGTTEQTSCYRRPDRPVKPHPVISPGHRDRTVAQPPSSGRRLSASADAVALLVLGLQDCILPARQSRRAWGLVERWLSELVDGESKPK